jgi:hypothetical protein
MGNGKISDILSYVLTPAGLAYGELPKALLKFHRSPEGARAAIEEHLVDGALCQGWPRENAASIFSVSTEHEKAVAAF